MRSKLCAIGTEGVNGSTTNLNNTNVGGVHMGEGSQVTVGSGDVVGGDKTTVGRDVINVGAGATVIFGAQAEVEEEAPAPGEPPFKGLQYFDESDAEWFFGREFLVAKLVGRLREDRFLAVIVGASGSGKSSVVRAGVVIHSYPMELRAFGTNRRTWSRVLHYAARDYVLIGLGLVILVSAIIMGVTQVATDIWVPPFLYQWAGITPGG